MHPGKQRGLWGTQSHLVSHSIKLPTTTRVQNPSSPQAFPTHLLHTLVRPPQKDPHPHIRWQRAAGVPTQGVGLIFSAVFYVHLVETLVIDIHTICHLRTGPPEPVAAHICLHTLSTYEHTHAHTSLPVAHRLGWQCAQRKEVCVHVRARTHTHVRVHTVLTAAAIRAADDSGALLRPRALGWGQGYSSHEIPLV